MKVNIIEQVKAIVRQVRSTEHEGKPAKAVVASRSYSTDLDDLWNAITDPERLKRWFLPVSGELRLGGRYQIEGNASGTIAECEPPRSLALTWEYGGELSWLKVALTPESEGRTRLELEHMQLLDEFWEQFGPGAGGVGWDLSLMGLDQFLTEGRTVDQETWPVSDDGKDFIRRSAQDWCRADISAGADPDAAREAAQRTESFYMGESESEDDDGDEAGKG